MTQHRPYNVLFLCTGNTARSILAEAYLNAAGRGKYRFFSAGSHPKDTVNPFALEDSAEAPHRHGRAAQQTSGRIRPTRPNPAPPSSISCLPSATTPPAKSAPSGAASR